jgi:hypothetical protein
MKRINSRRLLVGISLITAGILIVGVGIVVGGSIGGAVIATAAVA